MIDSSKMRRHERRRGREKTRKARMREKGEGEIFPACQKCDRQINKRLSVTTFNPLGDFSI